MFVQNFCVNLNVEFHVNVHDVNEIQYLPFEINLIPHSKRILS